MKYGNCLIGVILLKLKFPKGKLTILRNSLLHIHFMLKVENMFYHYKLKDDFLPFPLCMIYFHGNFVKQKRIYTKNFQVLDEKIY